MEQKSYCTWKHGVRRCRHNWEDIGQTFTRDTPTTIEWCELCGGLKFSRTAWDYKTWRRQPTGGSAKKSIEEEKK